jgi:hypothetical protein
MNKEMIALLVISGATVISTLIGFAAPISGNSTVFRATGAEAGATAAFAIFAFLFALCAATGCFCFWKTKFVNAERSKKVAFFSFALTALTSFIAFCCWAAKDEGDYAAAFAFQIISVILGIAGAVLAKRLNVEPVSAPEAEVERRKDSGVKLEVMV